MFVGRSLHKRLHLELNLLNVSLISEPLGNVDIIFIEDSSTSSAMHLAFSRLLGSLFLFSFSFFVLVNHFLADSKLLLDFVMGGSRFHLHPGVTDNVSHGEAGRWVVRQPIGQKVLELFAKETTGFALFVGFPKHVGSEFAKQFIVGVLGNSLVEWRVTSIHDEQNAA